MNTFRIFSDTSFDEAAASHLEKGAAPHEIIVPKIKAASVLDAPEADPSFALAQIAFGQPDLNSIRSSSTLKWIHLSTAGFTRYDTPEFRAFVKERGIVVTNSSSVYARACAEHTLAFMLAQSRLLPQALQSQTENGSGEWLALRGGSVSLFGQNVVILGFGGIAIQLVKLLAPFEMNITAMRRQPRGDEGVPTVTLEQLPEALAKADHVINILPDNAASQNFFDAEMFAKIKPGAVFHNIGRGTTVNQEALLEVLLNGKLAAAWLDVTDPEPLPPTHPLRHTANCHITPHTAGGHANEPLSLIRHFLGNLKRYEARLQLEDRIM